MTAVPGSRKQRGPNGERIRLPQLVERLAECAQLTELGWSVERIAFEIGVSTRTVERYRAMLAAGEPTELTVAERRHWGRSRVTRAASRGRSLSYALRLALEEGATVVGPDGKPVAHKPRSQSDSRPWVSSVGRVSGKLCRVIWPDAAE